jgi:hypothetical protein
MTMQCDTLHETPSLLRSAEQKRVSRADGARFCRPLRTDNFKITSERACASRARLSHRVLRTPWAPTLRRAWAQVRIRAAARARSQAGLKRGGPRGGRKKPRCHKQTLTQTNEYACARQRGATPYGSRDVFVTCYS